MHTHFHNGATIIIVAIAMYNIYYIHGYSYNIVAITMYNIYMVIATINSQYAQTITISVMYSKVRMGSLGSWLHMMTLYMQLAISKLINIQ